MNNALLRLCASFVLCVSSVSAYGVELAVDLGRAGAAAKAGDHATAIAALEQALDRVRAEAPLTLDPFVVVSRPAKSFGDIVPRKSTTFAGDDELLFYMEPKNLVYGEGGSYDPGFEVDLAVLDAEGDVVAEKQDFGAFAFTSKSRLQDIFVNLTVTLTGAPPGDYTIRFTVRDQNSDKSASAEKTITMQ